MKKSKTVLIFLILILWAGGLVLINRDILHFSYVYPFSRTFMGELDRKGEHLFSDEVTLKPAVYHIIFDGGTDGSGNAFVLQKPDGTEYLNIGIDETFLHSGIDLTVPETVNLIPGVRYDPETTLTVNSIRITSNHVLYKESLTRHLVLSAALCLVMLYVICRVCRPTLFGFSGAALAHAERVFLILLFLTCISNFPNFSGTRYIVGDDLNFHLFRIEGVAEGLKKGYFPVRIYLYWLANYGVGAPFYYPDVLLYIPALLRVAGFDILTAYNFFIFFCTFCALLTMFLTARRLCGEKAAVFAACLYAFTSYRLICIYYRAALGEIQAFIFYPLVIWGLYELFHEHPERWGIFALGFLGLTCTHLISVAIAGVFTLLYLLIRIRRTNRQIWLGMLKAALLTVLLTACFWLPMLEQVKHNDLVFNDFMFSADRSLDAANFLKWKYLFVLFNEWGGFSPYPGWPVLIVLLLRLGLLIRKPKERLVTDTVFLFGVLSLILATDLFPWQPFAWLLKRIQVSWRFLAPAAALLALAGGEVLTAWLPERVRKPAVGIVLAFCLLCSVPFFRECFEKHLGTNNGQLLADKEVEAGEYRPIGLTLQYIYSNKDTVFPDTAGAEVLSHKRNGLDFRFAFAAPEGTETGFTLPLIYNYGYRAVLTDESGASREIPLGKDEKGLIRVSNEGLPSGSIRVYYAKTRLQQIGEGITLLSVLGMLAGWGIGRRRNHLFQPAK